MTCGYGQQAVEVGGVARRRRPGTALPSNGAAAVLSSVSSLPGSRSEKSTSRSARSAEASTRPSGGTRDRGAEQAVVGADLRDPVELRLAVAEQDEPVGAGVGAVDHAEAVGGRLRRRAPARPCR